MLREKKIDFEFRHIEPDNRPDWFLAISPHKKVPVLRIDDKISLFESNAIAEYLDETIKPQLQILADLNLQSAPDPIAKKRLSERKVLIRADLNAPYGDVQKVIEYCGTAGMFKIEIAAAKPAPEKKK